MTTTGRLLAISFCCISFLLSAQPDPTYTNPILPGSYPDPSICRVGDTFYLVNSTFEYFPGLPIHQSKDLVNWELIGYGIHRKEQANGMVNLVDVNSDGGIHAPTIRYHEGVFYLITTNVYYHEDRDSTDFVNFILTATNPAGPWSDPYVLEGAPGIDPDIFFDEDGKVWYVGTHSPENPSFPGEGEIWLQEINLEEMSLTGERYFLWRGACGGVWVEGPHMYKRDGRYYLMVAEGGTSFNHAVMIAVSDDIRGPYTSNERNPIFTTRNLSYDNWVVSTGHADLIELADGRWFMVALGVRGDVNRGSNMGRETHLLPVVWEREPFEWKKVRYEWPVVAPASGRLMKENPSPLGIEQVEHTPSFSTTFNQASLEPDWCFRRVPKENTYELKETGLKLNGGSPFSQRGQYSFMGIRQTSTEFSFNVELNFNEKKEGSSAGMAIVQKDDNYMTYLVRRTGKKYILQVKLAEPGKEEQVLMEQPIEKYQGRIELQLNAGPETYDFSYSLDGGKFNSLTQTPNDHLLSKGYTGAYLGIYAEGDGAGEFTAVRYFVKP